MSDGVLQIRRHGMSHSPDRQQWQDIMEGVHEQLQEPGQAHELPLGHIDPLTAFEEYGSNGQGGLDALLAALEDRTEVRWPLLEHSRRQCVLDSSMAVI